MSQKLIRGLSLLDAFSLVVGTIIGTGVFLKTATMSQSMGSAWFVLLAWIVAGLLSMTGALAYAEIGSLFPKSGGEYAYLREGYGNFWGYLYGWTRFWVASPGTIAAYSVGAATFLSGFTSLESLGGTSVVAVSIILLFSALNCLKVSFGGTVQSVMTVLKIVLILGLAVGLLAFGEGSYENIRASSSAAWPGWSAFGSALLAALWAYDGWNNMPMVGAEIKSPEKNLPRALVLGILTILGIYAVINFGYFYSLPFEKVTTSNSNLFPNALPVATQAAQTFLGAGAVGILSLLFVFSALSAMNGSIMTSARVPFAMADDGLFFKRLSSVHAKTNVPVSSILVQALLSCLLAISGKFDQLTDYVIFSSWIFYALVTASVFVFRKKYPDKPRAYKLWGYPYLPAIFLVAAVLLLINTLITAPVQSLIGLGFILAGIPFYFYFKRNKVPSST